jgi:hypothetical protein
MKHPLITITCCLTLVSISFGQSKFTKDETIKSKIIALEKSGWDAWKNKNAEWFQTNTTANFLSINFEGISDKSQVIESLAECDVKSVSLEDFKFVRIHDDVVIMTYIANQDGVCGDNKLTTKVRARVNYVKRGGKWLEALYMETPITN